jgi:hypothetical protein
MHLRYEAFVTEVAFPVISTLFIPTVILFGYAFWLSRNRRDAFRHSPLLLALVCLMFWTSVALASLGFLGFPDHYLNAISYIEDREFSRRAFYYDQAIIIAALAYKLTGSHFLGLRLSRAFIGCMITLCAVILVGLAVYYGISLSIQPWIRRQSYSNQEALLYLIDLVSFTAIVLVIGVLDVIAFAGRRIRIHESNLPALFTISLLLPLLGFFILEPWHATLWLAFLIIALPVMLALLSAMRSGDPFTAKLVVRMFRYQVMAVFAMGRWFRDK